MWPLLGRKGSWYYLVLPKKETLLTIGNRVFITHGAWYCF